MRSQKSSLIFKSFDDLKDLLKTKRFTLPHQPDLHVSDGKTIQYPEFDEDLYQKAMEGVRPISKDNYIEKVFQTEVPKRLKNKDDIETLEKLTNLVKFGEGFNIADTPEYIEGTGYHVHPSIARRLHKGEFSIQAHIDLHGLRVDDAKEVFEKFLRWAVINSQKGILIIHGRGLSSPSEPVLKKKVIEWLTRGPWRKWIVAYSSARLCDGGAGAVYVLLRQRPVSRRSRAGRLKLKGGIKGKE